MYSRQEIADGFRLLGVAPGDVIMLHASVRAVGEIAGGPDQIHLALRDAAGSGGTMMMYVSCPSYYDDRNLVNNHIARFAARPISDARRQDPAARQRPR